MSDDLIFDDVADANDIEDAKPVKTTRRKKANAAPVTDIVLSEEDKEAERQKDWVTIYIDEEAGQANYVPVGHNGVVYQIMRGMDVKVPPEVIDVLKDAIAHRVVQVVDPRTGNKENVMRPYNAIPYRIVSRG